MLLWLWRRPVAIAPIRPLAWEPPYATAVALEKAQRQKKKNSIQQNYLISEYIVKLRLKTPFTYSYNFSSPLMRTFKTYTLNNFQTDKTVLLQHVRGTTLDITCLELTHPITGSLYLLILPLC